MTRIETMTNAPKFRTIGELTFSKVENATDARDLVMVERAGEHGQLYDLCEFDSTTNTIKSTKCKPGQIQIGGGIKINVGPVAKLRLQEDGIIK
jgi:hypothetical protein